MQKIPHFDALPDCRTPMLSNTATNAVPPATSCRAMVHRLARKQTPYLRFDYSHYTAPRPAVCCRLSSLSINREILRDSYLAIISFHAKDNSRKMRLQPAEAVWTITRACLLTSQQKGIISTSIRCISRENGDHVQSGRTGAESDII